MTEIQKNPLAKNFDAISLIRFAFPSMVMMLFMGLYTIVDTIFVARFVDTNALSSINIVCPAINLIVGLGTMLATGGSAVIAKKMGNGTIEEARSNFTLIVVAGAGIGLVITGILPLQAWALSPDLFQWAACPYSGSSKAFSPLQGTVMVRKSLTVCVKQSRLPSYGLRFSV